MPDLLDTRTLADTGLIPYVTHGAARTAAQAMGVELEQAQEGRLAIVVSVTVRPYRR